MDRRFILAALLLGSVLCMYGASRVNTWNGAVQVSRVVIPGENTISGVLYQPEEVTGQAPCVLLAHGIVNSKEPLSGMALELAKHGIVALSIDLVGHGRSSGDLDGSDPSLGVVQSAQYLADLPYTMDNVGLAGHSLGAGASYYAASHGVAESGLVLIGGGIGENYYPEEPSGFTAVQPRNVLVIVGRYDVLFDVDTLGTDLEYTLPLNTPELGQRKGNPEDGSMTMLLMPATSHLLEPIDPAVVDATVDWFNTINGVESHHPQTYLFREALILVGLVLFAVAMVIAPTLSTEAVPQPGFNLRRGLVYGSAGFVLFLPAMLLGNLAGFPPQLFGASIGWWMLMWGVVMSLLARFWRKDETLPGVSRSDVGYAVAVFLLGYIFNSGLETFFGFGFRLLVPIMRALTFRRAQAFLLYLPFMFVHFYSELVWFGGQAGNLNGLVLSKTGFFAMVLFIQYGGFFLLDVVPVGGFTGFMLEFLVAIVPMLLFSAIITCWSQRNSRQGASVILNTLLFSWIAAGLFPY